MAFLERDKDTITAVSTASGTGGIAVLRVSGSRALKVVRRVCGFLPADVESHRVYFGTMNDTDQGEDLDEVLVTYFADGKSYTGEETLEISCHGGTVISQRILKALISAGARLAEPGEFTYRAFMNGRIDLVQAEGVLQLIESQSERAARTALRQLKGGLSRVLLEIEDSLVWILAHLEANIDFAQEDIELAGNDVLKDKVQAVIGQVESILNSYKQGRIAIEGLSVALAGRPNVGKSSLLNALVGDDRAIVTDIPGTTRDLVEGHFFLRGAKVTVTDTAGLRESDDKVEAIGIERSRKFLAEADLVLFVMDDLNSKESLVELENVGSDLSERLAVLLNKADLFAAVPTASDVKHKLMSCADAVGASAAKGILSSLKEDQFFVLSAKALSGIEKLKEYLSRQIGEHFQEASGVVSNARQAEAAKRLLESLRRGVGLMASGASSEFSAFELHEAVRTVHELLGKTYDDQVMDRVFSEFCLGK